MALSTGQLSLSAQIQDWLLSSPTLDEVKAYAGSLPEEQYETIMSACQNVADTLYDQKRAYFQTFNSTFAQVVPEDIQVEYLSYLAQYNTISVQNKLQQLYPNVVIAGPGIVNWSKEYVLTWWLVSVFAAYKEYERQVLYLHSLCTTKPDVFIAQQARKNFSQILQTILTREIMLEQITTQEQEALEDQLRLLKIFPDDYITAVVRERPAELQVLLTRLIQVLMVAEEFIGDDTNIPQDAIDGVLLDLIRENQQQSLLRVLEVRRLREETPTSQFTELRKYLNEHISELNGNNFAGFQEVLAQGNYPSEDLGLFLYAYIRYSQYTQVILDGLDIDAILEALKQLNDLASLEGYIEKLVTQVTWEDLTAFKAFIHFLHKLVHTIPE